MCVCVLLCCRKMFVVDVLLCVIPAFGCSRRQHRNHQNIYKCNIKCSIVNGTLRLFSSSSSMHSAFSLLSARTHTHTRLDDTYMCVPRSGAIPVKYAIEYENIKTKTKQAHTETNVQLHFLSIQNTTRRDETRQDNTMKTKEFPKRVVMRSQQNLQLQVSPQ